MLKKTIISSTISMFATSAIFAQTYVGGGVAIGRNYHSSAETISVFAGKGKLLGQEGKYYLGGELGLNASHYSSNNNSIGIQASAIPGLMLSKSTMLYGRVGLESSFQRSSNIQLATLLGLGVQTNISKHWDIRTEYTVVGFNHTGQAGVGMVYKFD